MGATSPPDAPNAAQSSRLLPNSPPPSSDSPTPSRARVSPRPPLPPYTRFSCLPSPSPHPSAPTAYLPRHPRYNTVAMPARAIGELQTRVRSGYAPPSAANSTIAYILRRQADPAAPWLPFSGDFLESLRSAKKLADPA